jgi:hypothetical protein
MQEQIDNHDELCTLQAEELLNLGFLEHELACYGTAYQEKGEIKFYTTKKEETILELIKSLTVKRIYPTPTQYFVKRCLFLSDQEEMANQSFRLEVIRKLYTQFPAIYFDAINSLTSDPPTNYAFPILKEVSEQLNSCFDLNLLQLFGGLLDMAYQARTLTKEGYMLLGSWLKHEYEKTSEDGVASNNYEKTYACFAYLADNGRVSYYDNAFPYMVVEHRAKMVAEGITVSPIFIKQYHAGSFLELRKTKIFFKSDMEKYLNKMFMKLVCMLNDLSSGIDETLFNVLLDKLKREGTGESVRAFIYYGNLWNL